ncbi:MAG: hypothetical protein Q8K30_03740 [Candidatus Gracilibacteria bacterium]|nr:hypothetical protein [Candidatus Gracilibacteria bacterium]
MGIENNSSFENIPNSQVNKKSDEQVQVDMDKIDKSKNVAKINDILVLLEGKIDDNQEDEIRLLLNEQDFGTLDSFLKEQNNISKIQALSSPEEILNFFKNEFNNKTKGGESIDSSHNLATINADISNTKAKIDAIESKPNFGENDKDFDEVDALNKKLNELEDKKTAELIKSEDKKTEEVIKNEDKKTEEAIKPRNETLTFNETKIEKGLEGLKKSLPSEILLKHSNLKDLLDKSSESKAYNEKEDILNQIINILKNQDTLNSVANDLKEYDKQNGTNNYKSFRDSLISIDKSFIPRLDQIETGFHSSTDLLKLGTKTEKGLEKDGNILKQNNDDGLNIIFGDDGRKVGLSDSEYKINSDLGNESVIKDIQNKKQDFSKFMKGLNEELNSLSSIIEYIDNAIYNNIDIDEVKNNIKSSNNDLFNELNIDNIGSLEEIKNAFAGLYKKKEEEKDIYIKQAKRVVDDIIEKNASIAKQKDLGKIKTLKFLNNLGFDSIPQDITDQIINIINSSSLLNQLGFQNKIDIQNGNLGNNLDNNESKTGFQEQIKFAEFFNIILSGDKTKPIETNSLILGKPVFKNDNGQTIIDKNIYISKILGINPIGKLLGNIEIYNKSRVK